MRFGQSRDNKGVSIELHYVGFGFCIYVRICDFGGGTGNETCSAGDDGCCPHERTCELGRPTAN